VSPQEADTKSSHAVKGIDLSMNPMGRQRRRKKAMKKTPKKSTRPAAKAAKKSPVQKAKPRGK
jgi:hypothetical protein